MMAAWLYEHPRARRAWLMMQLLWGGWLLALLTAPPASAASAGAAELSWTGLHDSYGVPIGAHLVSTVPMLEALREQGPDFGLTPDSWGPALAAKSATALTYTGLAGMLAFESAALAFICAIGIWFVKFALSTTWLGWLAAAARPILASINAMVSWMQLEVGMGLICVAIGAVIAVVKGVGRGLGIMFGGVIVIVLTAWLLRDPIGTEVGDNGVLGIGRTIGFRLSQGFANNGSVSSGDITSQLDKLTSWLVDVLVREQIEQINFGRVIDDIPGCASIYSGALMSPTANPAHAVGTCAPDALAHAQQLSGGTAGLFALLILVICVVLFALCYVGAEVVRVGFKAFFHLVAIVPAAPFAIPPGPPREFVKRTAVKLVVHGVETLIATVGLGVLVILMANTTRGTLPGAIGMTHPVAKLVVMLLVGVFGAVAFRYLLRGLFGDRGLPGPVRIAKGVSGQSGRAESALSDARNVGRRAGATRTWLAEHTGKKQGAAGGEADPKAPARKAHPTPGAERPAAERRPPTAPSGESARPTPSGPGRGPGGAGARPSPSPNGSRTAAAAKTAVKVGVQAAAVAAAPEGAVAKVAVSAAAKHAPQVARAAGGRRRATRAQADGNGKSSREKPPARTPARAPAEQPAPPTAPSRRPPSDTKPADTDAKADVKQPQRPELPARRDAPPPARSGPAPSTGVT
jgi:hypothetical protein